MKKLLINRENINIDDKIVLDNYWYKFVQYQIQQEINQNAEQIIKVIGEERFEEFYEIVDAMNQKVMSNNFDANEYDSLLYRIGIYIEDAYLKNELVVTWHLYDQDYNVKFSNIRERTKAFFDAYILPYLQLKKAEDTVVICEYIGLKHLIELEIERCGIHIERKANFEIEKIELLKDNTNQIIWDEQDNKFTIVNDLNSEIQINIIIYKHDRRIPMSIQVTFPFFKSNDEVAIRFIKNEMKWYVIATNEMYQLEFRKEIYND